MRNVDLKLKVIQLGQVVTCFKSYTFILIKKLNIWVGKTVRSKITIKLK